mmetsp:Transcript_51696/g.77315  ORF Transcript_51696/g.77315 Transcript_51696/m.77315 type:complete len:566 (+) Transcript_51696:651-2348(+)
MAYHYGTMGRQLLTNQMDTTLNSIHALMHGIYDDEMLRDIPFRIGVADQPGSAPFLSPTDYTLDDEHAGKLRYVRNVTGICDDPTLVENYFKTANVALHAARLHGVFIHHATLLPNGVVCLSSPSLESSGYALGQDLFHDPHDSAIIEKVISSTGALFYGPIQIPRTHKHSNLGVHEPESGVGDIGWEKNHNEWLIYIPIDMPDSRGYAFKNHWGILEVSLDWDKFLHGSGILPFFEQRNDLGFVLKRENGDERSPAAYLARSKGVDKIDPKCFTWVELNYRDTEERWTLGVGVANGYRPPWFCLGIGMSILISLFVTSLFLFSLVTWQSHKDFLLEILPARALHKLCHGEVYAEKFDIVTIFFLDIVGYTRMSSEMQPYQVMKMLNDYFIQVDRLTKKHQIYKVETIGDAYMCVGGCPDRCMSPLGAQRVALFALDVIEMTSSFRLDDGSQLLIRCGINSGRIMAGVVGEIRPHFSLFGDTVNIASRMESTSKSMKIQCSDATYRLLRDAPDYDFNIIERGSITVKGLGEMNTWFVNGATKRRTDDVIMDSEKDKSTQSCDYDR